MNKAATVVVDGHAGTGLAENIMSGLVRVRGNASQSVAASGCGGLVVIASAKVRVRTCRTVDNQLEFGRLFDQQICHCPTL
jgi:formylmethanofuran dehydrogenase subunit C